MSLTSSHMNTAAGKLLAGVFCQNEHIRLPFGWNVLFVRDHKLIVFLVGVITLGSGG